MLNPNVDPNQMAMELSSIRNVYQKPVCQPPNLHLQTSCFTRRPYSVVCSLEATSVLLRARLHSATSENVASSIPPQQQNSWDISRSAELYRINDWGRPYFGINDRGHLTVRPFGSLDGSDELDLVELVEDLKKENIKLPMVIKFSDILQHRLHELQNCFSLAMEKYNYKNVFRGIFPVKCNHDSHLLENVIESGKQFKFGLEVGSKPELLIAITKLVKRKDSLLVCNGYKDQIYIENSLLARKIGIDTIIVLEQMKELDLVIQVSKRIGVRPVIGVRARLSTHCSGHWASTSGDHGKFGLTVNEILKVVNRLKHEGMLDCLRLLHFHIGSQISSIATIKEAMREGSHIYCELAIMGSPMGYIDVGGGLGIDYDGTKTDSIASTNYNMQNYANDVVAAILDACNLKRVPHPAIVSESGRALASHHSVLVFDVLSAYERLERSCLFELTTPQGSHNETTNGASKRSQDLGQYLLSTFREVYDSLNKGNLQEGYNDAKQFKEEANRLFKLGGLSLVQRAEIDALYDAVCSRLLESFEDNNIPDELKELRNVFTAVYHINLSVFRSVPDMWAIGQVFPIMPIQRLNNKPELQAILADLTCDSDGKINRFITGSNIHDTVLPVHKLQPGESYYIGLFLAGVYQEVMGSGHNLFGSTNVVSIKAKPFPSNGYYKSKRTYMIENVRKGDSIGEILCTVDHDSGKMLDELVNEIDKAVHRGCLTQTAADALLTNYRCCLDSYTYLT